MNSRPDILARLRAIGERPDPEVDLGETALLLAALDRPDRDLDFYRAYLATLAREVAGEADAGQSLGERRRALTGVLVGAHRYRGDGETYDDLRNANLMSVIDRRLGLPVALGILYLHAAQAQGWTAHGLNVPAHFLIRLSRGDEHVALDPFHGGSEVGAAEIGRILGLPGPDGLSPADFDPMDNRGVLLRLQNNIKVRALQNQDEVRAAAVLESMIALAPESAGLCWEAASAVASLGRAKAALALIDGYLGREPALPPPEPMVELRDKLRRMLN